MIEPRRHGEHGEFSNIENITGGVLCAGMVQLFHRELGGAGRPPLVILHGMLGSSRNWLAAGAALAEYYQVYALDLRNHGRSPHAATMNYATLADDVSGWLKAQGLARVTLLGHSLGGKVAMRLACNEPTRVEQLIVVDIAPRDYPEKLERAEFAAMNTLRLETVHTRGDAERAIEPLVPEAMMRKFLTTNLEQDEAGAWRWTINLPVLTAAVAELVKTPLKPEHRFSGRVRFITGGKSDFVQAEDAGKIRWHFPTAEITTIVASGHNPHMETRSEFIRAATEAITERKAEPTRQK